MCTEHSARSKRARLAGAVLAVVLAVSCAGEPDGGAGIGAGGNAVGDGSLGIVEVAAGEAVQIRSLEAITGDYSIVGLAIDRATALAVADYGPIRGFDVDLGASLDDLCSSDGGQAAAQAIVADADVVGVIGTSCSSAAIAAVPLVTAAGMVMISPSATSAALTSDLAGNPGPNRTPGFYRTAANDVFQAAAMAQFVHGELGLSTAAAIHDGDPFTQGLATAVAAAFEAHGGTVTRLSAINKQDSDMVPVLTEIAATSPQALFLPIFQPAADFVADYAELYGQEPGSPFWAHAYDATTLLLEANTATSMNNIVYSYPTDTNRQ